MRNSNSLKTSLVIVSLFTFVIACSHTPPIQEYPDTASPTEEISKLSEDLKVAAQKQVNVLSPSNYENAEEALNDAKKGNEKQKASKDILHDVAVGRAYLNQANAVSEVAHTNMEDVIVARERAIKANAPTLFRSEFRDTDEDLVDVTEDLEDNDLKSAAKERTDLQARYLELELKAIKDGNLAQARDMIELAKKEGAKDFAPRTLAIAEKSLKDADAYITANRHETLQVKDRSNTAVANATHLLKITRESKTAKKVSPEEIALQIESEKNKVVDKQAQLQTKEGELDAAKGQSAVLSAEKQTLESDQAFLKKFDEARAQFSPEEAEVYKEGNTLLIRLKGLEFPVSQAVIKGSNFPLLSKVQKVIKEFGDSSVRVEGHTDSQGGKLINEKLSSARAQAVKDYLVSNDAIEEAKIEAVGVGFQKPLASNKTAAGRAQNRRVDVVISPERGNGKNGEADVTN